MVHKVALLASLSQKNYGQYEYMALTSFEDQHLQVIGNIWENPELLKSETSRSGRT